MIPNTVPYIVHGAIQKERSIFLEVIVSVFARKQSLYKHVSIFEWLHRSSSLSIQTNSVRFLFVGLDEERSVQKKGGYTRRIAVSQCGCCFQHEET